MDEAEEFEFRLRAEQEAAQAAPPLPPTGGHGPIGVRPQAPGFSVGDLYDKNPLTGAAEVALKGTTNLASNIPGAIAYAGTAIKNAALAGTDTLGLTTPAPRARPREVMAATKQAFTYEPRTAAGQAIDATGNAATNATVGAVLAPVANAADRMATRVGETSPFAEEMLREAPSALEAAGVIAPGIAPLRAAMSGVGGAAERAAVATAERVGTAAKGKAPPAFDPTTGGGIVEGAAKASNEDTLGTLRAAGYRFRPSDVKAMKPGEKVPGLRRESLQEPSALKKDLTLHNSTVDRQLATEAIGTKDLSAKSFAEAKKLHFETYDAANAALYKTQPPADFTDAVSTARGRAGFAPEDSPTTTQVISALRKQERKGLLSDDTVKQHAAKADGRAADALEDAMEARLAALGEEKLHADYKASRQALAQIHDVETVTRGQQINPQKLREIDKRNPGRLNGPLKIIADAADMASNVVRHPQKATGVRSSVKGEGLFSAIKDVGRAGLSKVPGMNVAAPGFQSRAFGREASATERGTFADYGRRPEVVPRTPEPGPQLGAGNIDFAPAGGVTPPYANTLAGDLALAPEPVQNAQLLPDAPSMMFADTPPPIRGDIDFTSSMPQSAALAEDFGFAPRPGDGVPYDLEWQPPNMAQQMAPDLSMLPPDIAQQLGLSVDTQQPSLMTPVAEPVPYGPRVQLERPPGRVGKAPSRKGPKKVGK